MVKHGDALKDAARQFKDGTLDRDGYNAAAKDWRDRMAAEVKADHLCQGAVACGGFHNMGPAQHGAVGGALKSQYGYLNNAAIEYANDPDLVLGLVKGRRTIDERSTAMAQAGRVTFYRLEFASNVANGFQSVQSFLEDGAHHCTGPRGCPEQAKLGRVNVDDPRYIPAGQRACGPWDKCPQKYFKAKAPEVVADVPG